MKFLALLVTIAFASTSYSAIKVGIVFDKGGKDDKSFNQAAYEGLLKAKKDFGVGTKYVEASDNNSFEPMLRALAQKDHDLILGIGFSQAEAIQKVAAQFPQKHFAIVDAEVNAPNVRSLMFEEHQGSYLVGAAAALLSKTGKIGFLGGMDIPLIRRFEMGFEAGIKKINPKAKLVSNFVGVTPEAWNNPAKAKELTLSQYSGGVDIVYAAAGASNGGVFDAAEEKKLYAIGCDSNQNWIKPGLIVTSMLKRVDTAVHDTIQMSNSGKFASGTMRFGLQNKGIDYSVDQHNEKVLTPAIRQQLEALKKDIIAGRIQVPDFYKTKKK